MQHPDAVYSLGSLSHITFLRLPGRQLFKEYRLRKMTTEIILPLVQALTGPDAIKYLSIPFFAALIGWGTNWLAIKMTFWPIEYIGIKPWFGWQGIVPSKVEKMSAIVVDKILSRLGTLEEFFREMEPEKIAHHITQEVIAHIEEYTDEIMLERNAVLWENLPGVVKRKFYNRASKQIPKVVDRLIDDITTNIEQLVDPKEMIVKQASRDREMMSRVFQECGKQELKFVVKSGLYFGFPFGIIQMLVWIYYPQNWVLPAFGFMVGYLTNWIALNFVFRPLRPMDLGFASIQGLFLKRQKEVSQVFSRIVTQEMITIKLLTNEMMTGNKSFRTKALIKKHLKPLIEGGAVKMLAQLTVGPNGFVDLKRSIEEKAFELTTESVHDRVFNEERSSVVERLFRGRMEALSPEEFQDLLRPAFQEDEWILVILGAVLGLLAGVGQWLYIFGNSVL